MSRSKGESFASVKKVVESVIKVLLDDSNTGANKHFKETIRTASKKDNTKELKRLDTILECSVNNTKKKLRCDQCKFESVTKKTLNNHKAKKHKGSIVELSQCIQRYKCEHCGIEESSNRNLRRHNQDIHIGYKQMAGSKRTKYGEKKSKEEENTSPMKKKTKNDEKRDTTNEPEIMDTDKMSEVLVDFVFTKASVNTKQNTESDDNKRKYAEINTSKTNRHKDKITVDEWEKAKRKDDTLTTKKKLKETGRRKLTAVRGKKSEEGNYVSNNGKSHSDSTKKDPNIKELPDIVKQVLEEESWEYVVKGDGPCLIRTTAAHTVGDQDHFEQLARDLNTHEADYRDEYMEKIKADFPMEVTIGIKGESKTFQKGEENEFFDWLVVAKKGIYIWRNCIDIIALCNLEKMEIDVVVLDEDQSKVEIFNFKPDEQFKWKEEDRAKPNFPEERRNGKMTVLNYKNSHFNLIVQRDHMLFQKGSLKFQEEQGKDINELLGTLFKETQTQKHKTNEEQKIENQTNESVTNKETTTDDINKDEEDTMTSHIHCNKPECKEAQETFKMNTLPI